MSLTPQTRPPSPQSLQSLQSPQSPQSPQSQSASPRPTVIRQLSVESTGDDQKQQSDPSIFSKKERLLIGFGSAALIACMVASQISIHHGGPNEVGKAFLYAAGFSGALAGLVFLKKGIEQGLPDIKNAFKKLISRRQPEQALQETDIGAQL
ncbi:MAG: hypothetical protein AAF621_02000 [Pseudomonadota bacterium]